MTAEPAAHGAQERWHALLDPFDDRVEAVAARLRGRRLPDLLCTVASAVGDHGAVWVLVAAWQARRPGPRRRRAVGALALAGFSSLAVNTATKRAARRDRPDPEGRTAATLPLPLREPSSSSFPSGHTLAAWCAAAALSEGAGSAACLGAIASLVGASRVHVRAHHASDVVAGAALGTATGLLVRRFLPAPSPPRRGASHRAGMHRTSGVLPVR